MSLTAVSGFLLYFFIKAACFSYGSSKLHSPTELVWLYPAAWQWEWL